MDILKQHLKTSVKLKLGRKWVFEMDTDPKHTSKVVENGLRTTKSRYWSGHHKALTSSHRNFVGRTEKACASKKATRNV